MCSCISRAGFPSIVESSLDRECVCLRVHCLTGQLNALLFRKGDLLSAAEGHLRVENRGYRWMACWC